MTEKETQEQLEKAKEITVRLAKELSEAGVAPAIQAEAFLRMGLASLALNEGGVKKGALLCMDLIQVLAVDMLAALVQNPTGPDGADFPLEEVERLREMQAEAEGSPAPAPLPGTKAFVN